MRIAVDLMGGETPPHKILEAALEAAHDLGPACTLVLIADKKILPSLPHCPLEVIASEETIEMEESPLLAVRRKKNSSVAVGMRLVKDGSIRAFLSTGNTGALIATAMLHLPLLPTIERPGLLVLLPTEKGRVAVLDVGANLSAKPEHLLAYARLGVLYRKCAHNVESPSIGLLNIGEEDSKGTQLTRESRALIEHQFAGTSTPFLGNIEGREVFHGKVDVLVTDAFTGNVFLKTCEGASAFLMDYLEGHFTSIAAPVLQNLNKQFNYAEHPGALLAGLDGAVIKCHGYSNKRSLISGIRGAYELANKDVVASMKALLC